MRDIFFLTFIVPLFKILHFLFFSKSKVKKLKNKNFKYTMH